MYVERESTFQGLLMQRPLNKLQANTANNLLMLMMLVFIFFFLWLILFNNSYSIHYLNKSLE